MQASLLIWLTLQSLDVAWSDGCVQATDYVCNTIPTDYPPGVTSLVLFVSDMRTINSTVFNDTNLSSVTSLTVTQSGITDIAPGAFVQFHQLKTLNLQNNGLSHVTSAWFTHKGVLESLILSNNSIKTLSNDSFRGLLRLFSLNVSQNQIHSVASGSFRSLVNLRHLDLSNNKLRHLSLAVLIPLNNTDTKIYLHGNPWDCSCSVYKFAEYLRALQRTSRLPNEMEVLCESPADQRGIPVWNVSRCVNPNSGISQTLRPGMMSQPALISLIVVLCALVLVICVLSVLYHKKRERKLLLSIRPSVEEQEGADLAQPDHRVMMKSVFCGQKWKQPNNWLKSKQDQMVIESERVSHIYQIYSPGIHQMRETSTRARSAGPVLSRSEDFCQRAKTHVEKQEDPGMKLGKDQGSFAGWTETEAEQKEDCKRNHKMTKSKGGKEECGKEEGEERAEMTEMEKESPEFDRVYNAAADDDDDPNTTLKSEVIYKQTLMMEDKKKDEDSFSDNTNNFLHNSDDAMLNDKAFQEKTSSFARHQSPKEANDDIDQPLEDIENIPYLTIGADPEKQSSKPEQICDQVSTGQVNVRPIVRVQTWPPTAAQWKKQWTQHQHVLNVFPNLIFVTQYMHQVSMFPSSNPENLPQTSGVGLLPELQSLVEAPDVKPVDTSRELCKSDVYSYIQHFSSGRSEDYPELNEHSHTNSKPLLDNAAHSDLVSSRPLFKGMTSRPEEGRVIPSKETLTIQTSSGQKKTNQTPKRGQTGSRSATQPMRREGEGRKVRGEKPRSRTRSEFSSGEPPSGGSPSDDNLLVGNEYTLDLLHEVVENHGRWTRERWRQVHMNKPKKHLAKTQ